MSTYTASFTCPAGHPRVAKFREREGCAACREIEATSELVDLLTATTAELDAESITDVLAAASGSAKSRNELRAWLRSGPDVLRSGSSDCPAAGARVLAELARRGVDVVAPRCLDCGKARPLPKQVDGGRICQTCNVRRNAQACTTCGVVKPVAYRCPDGAAMCLRCRTLDPSTWQPCGRCGTVAQVVAIRRRAQDRALLLRGSRLALHRVWDPQGRTAVEDSPPGVRRMPKCPAGAMFDVRVRRRRAARSQRGAMRTLRHPPGPAVLGLRHGDAVEGHGRQPEMRGLLPAA